MKFFTRYIILFCILIFSQTISAQEYQYTYSLFSNSLMPGSWFYSTTAANGGSAIINIDGRLPVNDSIFHTPGNSLELSFQNHDDGSWKAIVFQHQKRGMEFFKPGAFLSFWIYVDGGMLSHFKNRIEMTSHSTLPLLQLMYSDSSLSAPFTIPPVKTDAWKRILIPLENLGKYDADHPENFIAVVFSPQKTVAKGLQRMYIDDIEFLQDSLANKIDPAPEIISAKGYAMHVDILWQKITDKNVHLVKIYRSENGAEYKPVGIQQPYMDRFADFTGATGKNYAYRIAFLNSNYEESEFSAPVQASTAPMTDEQLLTMVQEACFRYYWEGAEPVSGLARENIPGRQDMIATGASGFGVMALIAGTERHFITREEAVDRFLQILDFLGKADRFHGTYGHFMDGPTGKVEPFFGHRDNGADLVETSFLLEGLLTARQYFSGDNEQERQIRDQITRIWEGVEFDWFRREPDGKFLYWHWSPDQGWVINHRLIGWNETMVVYLLAIASPAHAVPATMYYSGWASQDKIAQRYRSNWGQSDDGSMYTNGNTYFDVRLDVGVNNGGPLFFTHYSYMGYDPHLITDKFTNYFTNNRTIALINYRYCVANPKHFKGYGPDGWGLTASDGPYDYSADEPVEWQDHGKLTPTGAIASFPYTPEESMAALKNYYYNCGSFLWGEYGFRDAYSLSENWCSEIFMGLNQAPMVVMIENFRTGLIWRLFMQNPEIQEGLNKF